VLIPTVLLRTSRINPNSQTLADLDELNDSYRKGCRSKKFRSDTPCPFKPLQHLFLMRSKNLKALYDPSSRTSADSEEQNDDDDDVRNVAEV
jgi:hypothetical protein